MRAEKLSKDMQLTFIKYDMHFFMTVPLCRFRYSDEGQDGEQVGERGRCEAKQKDRLEYRSMLHSQLVWVNIVLRI
jgi:hypothetical protein